MDDGKGGKSTQKESKLVSRPSGEEIVGGNGGKPTHKGQIGERTLGGAEDEPSNVVE